MKEDEKNGEKRFSAWIDRENLIVSFRRVEGFVELQFPTHGEMFAFVIQKSESGYRIQ